jgi:hypothetical protein
MTRQFTLHLSYENADPHALAEALLEFLDDVPLSAAQNPLSGGVELRFHFNEGLVRRIENWLTLKKAVWDIDRHD